MSTECKLHSGEYIRTIWIPEGATDGMAVGLLVGEDGLNDGYTDGLEVGAVQYNNNYMNESLEANIFEIDKCNGYVNTVWQIWNYSRHIIQMHIEYIGISTYDVVKQYEYVWNYSRQYTDIEDMVCWNK